MTRGHDPVQPFDGRDPDTAAGATPGATPGAGADGAEQPAGGPAAGATGAGAAGPTESSADAGNDLQADLDAAQAAVASLTEDLQRLQAEYVNYKRRVDRDRGLVLENARYTILSALLPVLDDLDRAREHGELEGGFKAVGDSLERIVAGQGLVKFGKPGDEFDPRFHEALMHSHSPDVTTTTCQAVVTAGYQIGERVVRPARVTVVDPEPEGGEPVGAGETGQAAKSGTGADGHGGPAADGTEPRGAEDRDDR